MTVGDSSLESSYRMEGSGKTIRVSVLWKGNKYTLEIDSGVSMKDLGYELRKLTDVTAETLRLIVPRLNEKGSKLIFPFSDEHSSMSLKESNIIEDKTIRMMGVTEEEVDGVLKDAMPEMRILGFEEEERRLRQKKSSGSIKLPQGNYIFCDFRTLHLPGVDLNPPPSAALKRMHMLAADPGIIAIMNKHRWRVGIMTELAPVGYVGVSPQCLLGFNKNQGEEISLRLRTDDLKGFRKYQSIKKTLLHELAHMVYTEHDENFYALDRQLNKEAESLDWTKSRGRTLTGTKFINDFEEDDFFDENENVSQRLGGNQSDYLGDARESSVAAAYRRLSHTSEKSDVSVSKLNGEPDPDDLVDARDENKQPILCKAESDSLSKFEPDPDHTIEGSGAEIISNHSMIPSNPRDPSEPEHHSGSTEIASDLAHPSEDNNEPDPDDLETRQSIGEVKNKNTSIDKVMSVGNLNADETMQATPDPNNAEPYPDNNLAVIERETIMEVDEPDPDDQEIQRIQNSVTIISNRLKKAINALKTEVSPSQATNVLRMLLKIVRNIIEQPHEIKFKRLRKGNPAIQRNILNFTAAIEILTVVGFAEEMISESTGAQEPYLVLKRNDPGLLWIAKSMIEESHTTGS